MKKELMGIYKARVVEVDIESHRVRIRIVSLHGSVKANTYRTNSELPWATMCLPFRNVLETELPDIDDVVFVAFEAGDQKAPVVIGYLWSSKADLVSISFDSNEGTEVETLDGEYGSEVLEPVDPTRVGYTFDNWYEEEDLSGDAYVFSIMPHKDFILYANWIANTYTLTYDSNGGEVLDPVTKTITYDSEIGELPIPVRDGYTFVEWNSLVDGSGDTYILETIDKVADDITIYAQWIVA